jgi:acetyltransferase-like isoleucine patch superfamily enzyme
MRVVSSDRGASCSPRSSFENPNWRISISFGHSIVGSAVNLEAGSIAANYRNELPDPTIRILHQESVVHTRANKFGALIGDGCKIGANAVIAPGAILEPNTVVPRLALVEQYPPQLT